MGHSLKPCLPIAGLLAQGQYDLDPLPPFPDHVQYTHYSDQIGKGLAHPQVSPRPATPSRPAWLPDVHGSAGAQVGQSDGNCMGWSLAQLGPPLPLGLGASLIPTHSTFIFAFRQPGLL